MIYKPTSHQKTPCFEIINVNMIPGNFKNTSGIPDNLLSYQNNINAKIGDVINITYCGKEYPILTMPYGFQKYKESNFSYSTYNKDDICIYVKTDNFKPSEILSIAIYLKKSENIVKCPGKN